MLDLNKAKEKTMKHIFILNPMAGNGEMVKAVKSKLESLRNIDWETYETKAPMDATEFVKRYCTENKDPVRFYACGGDGTIQEVASGVVGFPHAEMSCLPCGSGNDFVKCFGGIGAFDDIQNLAESPAKPIDLMKVGDKYSINIVNFGFDTCVANTMIKVKRKKIIGGKHAYTTGVVMGLLKAMKNKANVYADGEKLGNGKFLLCTIANGQYVGGSFHCAPKSEYDDGYLDVCYVNCISRFKFLKLIGVYTEGTHLDDERFKDFITYRRVKEVRVEVPDGFCLTLDGEVFETRDFTVEVIPSAIRFAAPRLKIEAEKDVKEAVTV